MDFLVLKMLLLGINKSEENRSGARVWRVANVDLAGTGGCTPQEN